MEKKFWSNVWYFLSLSIPNKCSWKLFRYLFVLKVNWNAETSWSLSQDFEALKTVSKEFLRNSFSFSRYGLLKSSFLLIRKVSEKGRGNVRSIRESHAKELWRQRRSLCSLQVRFINDSELCSVPVARWNSSNLTWIWFPWTRTVPKNISWMKNRHTCYECGAKWCVRANQRHHGESDSDVDDDPANDEDKIEDINPIRNALIRQIGMLFISAIF